MLRQRSASVIFRMLAASWFAFATLLGHAFHLHEHAAEEPCTVTAEHEHGACEATSLAGSFAHHVPTAAHEDACPACTYLSQTQLAGGGASPVARACITPQLSPDEPIFLAKSVAHAFDSRGPPLSLPTA